MPIEMHWQFELFPIQLHPPQMATMLWICLQNVAVGLHKSLVKDNGLNSL